MTYDNLHPLRILITTDFDTSVFNQYDISVKLFSGGWKTNRIPYNPNQLASEINSRQIEVVIVEVEEVTKEVFKQCPSLKLVASLRANPVNIDLEAAKEAGVKVIYTPGRNAQAVAELTLALTLDVFRNLSKSHVDMRQGNWGAGEDDPYLRYRGNELKNKTVGLLGFGAVGKAVAKILSGFSTNTLAYDIYQPTEEFNLLKVQIVDFDELLGFSDILSIHLPLNTQTRDMIGMDEIPKMKQGAVLVNTARAHIVNKEALIHGLASGKLGAAALDVHYEEPPIMDILYQLPNCLFTPHIGGATYEVITHGSILVAADLYRWVMHQKIENQALEMN
jgi:D-3-phosphoglycerate dehydrogenase